MKFIGISLVTNDVPGLTDFYTKVLIGVEAEGDDVHVELKNEGAGMTLFSISGMEELAPGSMQGAGTGNFIIGFEVEDVDAEYDRLKEFEVEFIKTPKTHPWGTRSLWFRDPDGNIVNFFTKLSSI